MQNNKNDKSHQIHFPLLVGHRGMGEQGLTNSECYLENTIGSFLEAADEGAHYVEFDVQITKDEVPIIHHNFTLKGKYLINMTADEFLRDTDDIVTNNQSNGKSYDSCSKITGKRMYIDKYKRCTLEEVFTECQNLGFNVEIKFLDEDEQNEVCVSLSNRIEEYLKPILDVVAKYEKTNLFYSSFSLDVCKHLMKAQNDHSVFYLEDKDFMTALERAKENKFAGLVIDTDIFEMSYIKLAKNAGLRLILYGKKTNDRAFVTEFVKNGGDGVITDKIREIRSAFSQTQ